MDNPQELKKAILAALAEKGDYGTILKHLDTDEKEQKSNRTYNLIEPISAFADLLTQNVDGVFTDKLSTKIDEETEKALQSLQSDITTAKETLQNELQSLLSTTKEEMVSEHLERYKQAEKGLSDKMMQAAIEVASAKAEELLPSLADAAKLTDEEVNEIIDQAALSVESQVSSIIGKYIEEQKISVDQITGFQEAVRKLLPKERQVTWDSIKNKPNISPGGTNRNLVKQMIDTALDSFSGGLPDQTGNAGKFLTTDGSDASWGTPAGSGDVVGPASAVNNNLPAFDGTTGKLIKDSGLTTAEVAANTTYRGVGHIPLSQKGATSGVAELDAGGKVPAAQLPSFVDDVLEYTDLASFPATGETGKIYVAKDTNIVYRWSGTAYVEISASLALGETSSTAYRGDRGKIAYDHSQVTTGNPHDVTKAEVGLGNVDNVSAANLRDRTTHTGSQAISTVTGLQDELDGKAPLASPTLTGTTTVDRLDYDQAVGTVVAGGALGATETINWAAGTHFSGTLDSNITFTYSNSVTGQSITLYLSYDGTAQRTITWPATTWLDGTDGSAPTAPSAAGEVLVVTVQNIGGTYYGSATGNYAV